MDTEESVRAEPNDALRSALRWQLAGLAVLGIAVGFFSGTSRDPIVATLLPLLFGLLGGAGGLYVASADFSDEKLPRKLATLGQMLLVFSISVISSGIYGVMVRTGANPLSPFLARDGAVLPLISSPRRQFEMIEVRARLDALGASPEEQSHILDRMGNDDTMKKIARIREELAQLSIRFEVGAEDVKAKLGEEEAQRLEIWGLGRRLQRLAFDREFDPVATMQQLLEVERLALVATRYEKQRPELLTQLRSVAHEATRIRNEIATVLFQEDPWLLGVDERTFGSADRLIGILRSNVAGGLPVGGPRPTFETMAPIPDGA